MNIVGNRNALFILLKALFILQIIYSTSHRLGQILQECSCEKYLFSSWLQQLWAHWVSFGGCVPCWPRQLPCLPGTCRSPIWLGAHCDPKACSGLLCLLFTSLNLPALPSVFYTLSMCPRSNGCLQEPC